MQDLAQLIDQELLSLKIRFPILEYCTFKLLDLIPEDQQIEFCDLISDHRREGGNVLLGIMLQKRTDKFFDQSMEAGARYIQEGGEWYVCDIISERLYGHALLTLPERTLHLLHKNAKHPSDWMRRSVGVAAHYATKKGLSQQHVRKVFELLLTLGNHKDHHTKRGIGWGAKTACRFHPEIATIYEVDIANTGRWFQKKVQIGLQRSKVYAKRD